MLEAPSNIRSILYIVAVYIGPLVLAACLYWILRTVVGFSDLAAASVALVAGALEHFGMRFILSKF